MTKTFERTRYNREKGTVEHAFTESITLENGIFSVTRDGKTKVVKVVPCMDYVYKLQKTQIKAIDGAAGLFTFLDDELSGKGACMCLAWKILDYIMEVMK